MYYSLGLLRETVFMSMEFLFFFFLSMEFRIHVHVLALPLTSSVTFTSQGLTFRTGKMGVRVPASPRG